VDILSFKKKTYATLSDAPAYALPIAGMWQRGHVDEVASGEYTGTPDSLTGQMLGDQIQDILDLINARIRTIHPDDAPTNWILLWRSNNDSLDSQVTKRTVSIYWRDGHLIMLTGAYMFDADTIKAGNDVAVEDSVTMLSLCAEEDPALWKQGVVFAVRTDVTAGTTWAVYDDTDWTTYSIQPGSHYLLDRSMGTLYQWGMDTSGDVPMGVYYGQMGAPFPDPSGNGFALVSGAWYNHDTGLWQGGSSLNPVIAHVVADGQVFTCIHKSTVINETWTGGDWDVQVAQWYESFNVNAFPTIEFKGAGGVSEYDIFDRCRCTLAVENNGSSSTTISDSAAVTWHARLPDIDAGDDDILINDYAGESWNWSSDPNLTHSDEWGCELGGASDFIGLGVQASWTGYVRVYCDAP
jgi:hypothetical protein